MGLLGKLFGGDFASRVVEGDGHFAKQRWGEAKLGYESALSRAKDVSTEELARLRERIDVCRVRLVDLHVAEARTLAAAGEREPALERLDTAMELAPNDEVRAAILSTRDAIERAEARAEAAVEEVTEDDLYEVISGTWEDEQLDEYESHGDALRPMLLALHEGRGGEVVAELEARLAEADEPCYLHLEHGRALLQADRRPDAEAALRRFLEALEPGEGGRMRAQAHDLLARLALEAGNDEAAERELRACLDALPEECEPLVLFARFLRTRGRVGEALEYADEAVERMGTMRPHLPAIRELGLALAASGDKERALAVLESAVEIHASNDDFDFDPEFAITIAKLCEEQGDPGHAADFYRHLAAGSDRAHHYAYNLEAGRLLAVAGRRADARRYLSRAVELAADAAARTAAEEKLASLGSDEASS